MDFAIFFFKKKRGSNKSKLDQNGTKEKHPTDKFQNCTNKKAPYTTSQKLYNTRHNCKHYTQLYTTMHIFAKLHTTLQNKLYKTLQTQQLYTTLYTKIVQSFTKHKSHKTFQHYTILQNYTKLCKTLQNFTKLDKT